LLNFYRLEKEKSSGWNLTTSLMKGGTACRCFIAFLSTGLFKIRKSDELINDSKI